METKLLPCPFCGSKKVYARKHYSGWWVACDNQGCTTSGPWDLAAAGAIEKWNNRATTVTVPIIGTLDASTRIPQP